MAISETAISVSVGVVGLAIFALILSVTSPKHSTPTVHPSVIASYGEVTGK